MNPYQLTHDAEADLDSILQYSYEQFGVEQMLRYNERLINCFTQLAEKNILCREIELNSGKLVQYLHCQKHYIFAVQRTEMPMIIIGIFHERMDLIAQIRGRL
jgi:plasmid stabilization system protein ParE